METNRRDKLLVLKAFYLGHKLSDHSDKVSALEMINKAINQLKQLKDSQSKLRLLFYVLLKAETNRHGTDVVETRKYAKELASELGGIIFEDFMSIENETQTLKKVYGINKGVIADKGIKTTDIRVVGTGFNKHVERYDIACGAVGVNPNNLSAKELHFLHQVPLAKMLEAHGIQ